MSTFVKGGSTGTPFGRNEILRSTHPEPRTESYTFAAATLPTLTIDGVSGQKILQPGVVLAKITSGADSGKVGPAVPGSALTDGRQTSANIVGINYTFLPWQLMERDVEVSVIYEGSLVQAWCLEYNVITLTDISPVALTNATAAFMQRGGAAGKKIDISWS